MLDAALGFLQSFGWCGRVRESYLGIGIPGVVAVFLFRIVPKGPKVDELIWVVVGDVPPAYLVTDNAPNPAAALDAYIGEMETWVRAARSGESVSGLIPVNVPPTTENAEALERRLKMLDDLLRDIACL
jgi:hypothetical protein